MKKNTSYFFQLVFWWFIVLIDSSEDESWEQNAAVSLFMGLGIVVPVFSFLICLIKLSLMLSLTISLISYLFVGILTHLVFKGEGGESPVFIKMNVVKND